MSSSSSSNYGDSDSSDESAVSCVVQKWPSKPPKCRFLVKGGDVDDYGAIYNVPYESPFHFVYADYARKVGVSIRDIKLTYNKSVIGPDSCPFSLNFVENEVVLAYAEDLQTPMPIKSGTPATKELVVFNVIDMVDHPKAERLVRSKQYKVKHLYSEWGCRRDVEADVVSFYLHGECLDYFVERDGLLLQAGIYDGALLYAKYFHLD